MNIYEYFNSRDVVRHCKKRNHSFTGREMAYLIWQSNHHTLHQKIAAWKEIIRTMPNEEHEDFEYKHSHGLHDFLRIYIDRLTQFLKDFQKNRGTFVYSYERLHKDYSWLFADESPLFTSYELCVATAVAEASEKNEISAFRVKKRKLYGRASTSDDAPMLYLTTQGEPMDVHVAPYRGEVDLLVAPFGFYGMFVDIPTPFKQGDIVTGVSPWGTRSDPMVINKLPGKHGEDYIDMCAVLWDLDSQKRLVCVDDHGCLSLEYYYGELKKHKRFLFALQNYTLGKLPLEELLRSYAIVLLEFFAEDRIDFLGWDEEMEKLAGMDRQTIFTI